MTVEDQRVDIQLQRFRGDAQLTILREVLSDVKAHCPNAHLLHHELEDRIRFLETSERLLLSKLKTLAVL